MDARILLVDDSRELLDAYVEFLRATTTYEVRAVSSGAAALELLRTWRPDIVVTDVTDRSRREEETARAERLHALGEMAGGVAHDFNNVLTVILGNAQYLLLEDLPAEVSQTLQAIDECVCMICGEELLEDIVLCRRCKTPHHRECWLYYGACSTYGCKEPHFVSPRVAQPISDPPPSAESASLE